MKRLVAVVLVSIIAVLLFLPIHTILVPEWKIRVIDERGNPYRGKMVRQSCSNYILGIHPCEESGDATQYTDDNGYVIFPERKITASLLSRLVRTVFHFIVQNIHGGWGIHISVDSSGPQGYKRLDYKPGEPFPSEFILPSDARLEN
jgi:hypothetical protein